MAEQTPEVAAAALSSPSITDIFESCLTSPLFACGGSVPIVDQGAPDSPSPSGASDTSPENSQYVQTRTSSPVTLRWDPKDPSTQASHCKLTFPLGNGQQDSLPELIRAMEPASFGVKNEEVYDETYRKASKLDTSRFCCTFNPCELGIIDAVAQLLLPNLQVSRPEWKRGVRAELYKLNVYSGPSGHFRAHVDTPRSVDQFGSLVVCLPVAHTGGQLKIQSQDQDVVFDWGAGGSDAESSPAIKWAAFYSDCTHEVSEVTSGHRITLTYNLFATSGGGAVAGVSNTVDITQLPLYKELNSLTKRREAEKRGRYIGVYTTYKYPHTSKVSCLPYTLKGVDMAVWEILGSLGYKAKLVPVGSIDVDFDGPEQEHFIGHKLELDLSHRCVDDFDLYDHLRGLANEWSLPRRDGGILRHSKVLWLNESRDENKERQLAYACYGNEPSVGFVYATCAIIGRIPSRATKE